MKQVINSALLREFDNHGVPQNDLPSVAYTSDSFLELENSYLFSRKLVADAIRPGLEQQH